MGFTTKQKLENEKLISLLKKTIKELEKEGKKDEFEWTIPEEGQALINSTYNRGKEKITCDLYFKRVDDELFDITFKQRNTVIKTIQMPLFKGKTITIYDLDTTIVIEGE